MVLTTHSWSPHHTVIHHTTARHTTQSATSLPHHIPHSPPPQHSQPTGHHNTQSATTCTTQSATRLPLSHHTVSYHTVSNHTVSHHNTQSRVHYTPVIDHTTQPPHSHWRNCSVLRLVRDIPTETKILYVSFVHLLFFLCCPLARHLM